MQLLYSRAQTGSKREAAKTKNKTDDVLTRRNKEGWRGREGSKKGRGREERGTGRKQKKWVGRELGRKDRKG